jgi:hypothetical protein
MTPKGRPRREGEHVTRITVDLPEPLWRALKIRAIDQHVDMRSVVIEALELLFRAKPKRGGA